ncbi:MAG: hypothetical protein IH993_00420, partial [Proteobacteria bacterium]|nr:hypothetical protein [Pseudomonadota bacterium]
MFARLYTGDDGQSHMEVVEPPTGPMGRSPIQTATGITFRLAEAGEFMDWHPAPRRQHVITLSGEVEIGLGDGSVHRFGPGDVMLAEDLTGQGHTTRSVG